MAKRRRAPDMTPEQERTFLQLLQFGLSQASAARKLGFSPTAISMRKKRRPEFRMAIEAAEAGHELGCVANVQKAAARGEWKPAAWLLERKYPERWAKPEIRAQLMAANIDVEELKKAFQAGLKGLARMWAPADAELVDADGGADSGAPDAPAAPGVTRS